MAKDKVEVNRWIFAMAIAAVAVTQRIAFDLASEITWWFFRGFLERQAVRANMAMENHGE